MAKPIATTTGICFAFPDVLKTPAGTSMVPIPYPNIAQLADATQTASTVNAGGKPVILDGSRIETSTGGEAGTGMGVTISAQNQACTFTSSSLTVTANGQGVVRQFDTTDQNNGNAKGQVMVGLPTVLVGD